MDNGILSSSDFTIAIAIAIIVFFRSKSIETVPYPCSMAMRLQREVTVHNHPQIIISIAFVSAIATPISQ